jgi:ankyrin repeat protein
MTFLLQSGTNVNSRDISGCTVIHLLTGNFASKLTLRLAHILITEFGADVDIVNRYGYTPLFGVVSARNMTLQGPFQLAS